MKCISLSFSAWWPATLNRQKEVGNQSVRAPVSPRAASCEASRAPLGDFPRTFANLYSSRVTPLLGALAQLIVTLRIETITCRRPPTQDVSCGLTSSLGHGLVNIIPDHAAQ